MTIIDTDTGEIIEALSMDEQNELAECEAKIERGLQTFYEVGEALLKIRDSRLYRDSYGSFEAYCAQRWMLSKPHAHRLIAAVGVVKNLVPLGTVLPVSESLTRPLRELEPEQQREVWQGLIESTPNGEITARQVEEAVQSIKQPEPSPVYIPPVVREPVFDYKRDAKSNRAADEYEPQGYDACQTPAYAIDPLLPYLDTDMIVWEPAAGEGLLVEALYDSGFDDIVSSDILTSQNFFDFNPERWDVLVTNPPFSLKYKWMARCYELGKPFALLLPVETLGAKTAQELMQRYGFEILLLNRRVSFKMPNKGWDGKGAQFPVMWLCWQLLPEKIMFGEINLPKGETDETD